MTTIGILSDTHALLREEVLLNLTGCDIIIHAGDIVSDDIIHTLQQLAPCYFVKGNADTSLTTPLKEALTFTIEGLQFQLIHNKKQLKLEQNTDIVVFGHNHKYSDTIDKQGVRFLNPGCCGKRRIHQEVTMMLATVDGNTCQTEKILLAHPASLSVSSNHATVLSEQELDKQIEAKQTDIIALIRYIVKKMDAGEPIEKIVSRKKVSKEFVEMIYRIKVTHPGVNATDIYNKLEVNETIKKEFL